jgi:hypothetical protein
VTYGGGVVLVASGWSFGPVLRMVTVRRLPDRVIRGGWGAGLRWVSGQMR